MKFFGKISISRFYLWFYYSIPCFSSKIPKRYQYVQKLCLGSHWDRTRRARARCPGNARARAAPRPVPRAQRPGQTRAQHQGKARAQLSGQVRARSVPSQPVCTTIRPGARPQSPGHARAQHPGHARAQRPGHARAQRPGHARAQRPGQSRAQLGTLTLDLANGG